MSSLTDSFTKDLVIGQRIERYVLDSLCKRNKLFNYAHAVSGAYKGADIVLNLGIEVKYDFMAATTGNVAIEVSCSGQPSGITASLSTFWVIVIPPGPKSGQGGAYLAATDQLRHAVRNQSEIPAGDNKAARVVLLPISDLTSLKGVYRIADAPVISEAG